MRGQSGFVTKNSDIYGYGKILEKTYFRIESSAINQENKRLILRFLEECLANGLSKARIIKYGATLLQLARIAGKPFKSLKKEDILRIVKEVELRNYSEWTKRDYKIILKKFYRWLRGSEEYPEEVRWIRPRTKSKTVLPEEILTTEEVKLMAEKAENLRDKAFILVLYESGCRIGEILSLKLKHVQNDEDDTNKKLEIRRDLETIMGSYAPSLLFSDKPYLPAPPIQECSGEIKLGNVVQGGLTAFTFGISLDELNKHIAIFGSTGSGKANAPEKQH